MTGRSSPPASIGGILVPRDAISRDIWSSTRRALPTYLWAHSVRSYCWGAVIAAHEGWSFDDRILWIAALLHDAALTRIPRNGGCFEVVGAEAARRRLIRAGVTASDAERVARAIVLHMQPSVTLADGVELVLLDRATGLDVRGAGFELVNDVRDEVVRAFPRGDFDRRFLGAISREVERRPGCQSDRLLNETGLARWMATSPWRTA